MWNCTDNLADGDRISKSEPNSSVTQVSLSILIRFTSTAGAALWSGNSAAKSAWLPPPSPIDT